MVYANVLSKVGSFSLSLGYTKRERYVPRLPNTLLNLNLIHLQRLYVVETKDYILGRNQSNIKNKITFQTLALEQPSSRISHLVQKDLPTKQDTHSPNPQSRRAARAMGVTDGRTPLCRLGSVFPEAAGAAG